MITGNLNQISTKRSFVEVIKLPEVINLLRQLPHLRKSQTLNNNPDYIITEICDWLKPIIEISFPYAWPTHGITDAIDQWLYIETRPIQMLYGDYTWVNQRKTVNVVKNINHLREDHILYLSYPFAGTGNYEDFFEKLMKRNIPIALDLAYVGTTALKPFKISSNVEFLFYGLTKSFGAPELRIGYLFSQKYLPTLQKLYKNKYLSLSQTDIASKLLNLYKVDHFHQRLSHLQADVCRSHDFHPSDSALLALQKIETVDGPMIKRISLGSFYNKLGLTL